MRTFNKLFFIAGSIVSLLINNVYADETITTTSSETIAEKIEKERYYMVFVKSSIGIEKRDESDTPIVNTPEFINNMVSEIHSLIVDNKDTYVDTEKFEALEETQKLRKRNNKKRTVVEENDTVGSPYVYPISSVEDSTVLYAYLNEDLVPEIEGIEYVSSVHIGEHFEINQTTESEPYNIDNIKTVNQPTGPIYNIDEIKKYTGWKDVTIKDKTNYKHLSLISQGQFRSAYVDVYDNNYYYPSTAGEGINIIVMDTGFNFYSPEFSNTNEREVKCIVEIKNATAYDAADEKFCGVHEESIYHGEIVSDMAGGLNGGVAVKANIYGVALHYDIIDKLLEENIFAGIQYIIDNLVKPHKTIVNISSGKFYRISKLSDSGYHYQMLIRQLIELGAIVTASAGNQGAYSYNPIQDYQYFPCSISGVICVGGTDQFYPLLSNYDLNDFSNSGETVDVYAPFFVYADYRNSIGTDITADLAYGTSFSAPLAAGVAALVMAEKTDINFDSYSMSDYLGNIALKDIIGKLEPDLDHNLFLNNGKNIVYSGNGYYVGCGPLSGFSTCSNENFPTCDEKLGVCRNDQGDYDYLGRWDNSYDFSIYETWWDDETWSDYPTDWDDDDPEAPEGLLCYYNGEPIFEWDENAYVCDEDDRYREEFTQIFKGNGKEENTTVAPWGDPTQPTEIHKNDENITPTETVKEQETVIPPETIQEQETIIPTIPTETIKEQETIIPTETTKEQETITPIEITKDKETVTITKTMTISSIITKPNNNKTTKDVKQNTKNTNQKDTKDIKQKDTKNPKQINKEIPVQTTTKATIHAIRLTRNTKGYRIKTNRATRLTNSKPTNTINQKTNAKTTPTPIANQVRIVEVTNSIPVNIQDVFKSWGDRLKGYFSKLVNN